MSKPLYNENSSVTIVDDGDFIGSIGNYKITKINAGMGDGADTGDGNIYNNAGAGSGAGSGLEPKSNGAGFLKVYAPWCPHCQNKVVCMNRLGDVLSAFGLTVYVLDAEANPEAARTLGVTGYPSFFHVSKDGTVGGMLRTSEGQPVGQVYEIIAALCNNDKRICKYISDNKDKLKGCDYEKPRQK
jgi:thiol-disulfide isomerase/thioredoxin